MIFESNSHKINNPFCVAFEHIFVVQNNYCILHDISISLTESRVAIIGNNGSGKSTFARCACGVQAYNNDPKLPNTTCNISIHGTPLSKLKKEVWKHINTTFQIPDQQIIMPTVKEELMLGLHHSNFDTHTIKTKIDYALDMLQVKSDQSCHSLSAGQKRLLCLLSVLLIEPRTLILDEPTTFLDMPTKNKIMKFINQLPIQLILITHDLFLIEKFPRVVCFDKGKIFADGTYSNTIQAYKNLW